MSDHWSPLPGVITGVVQDDVPVPLPPCTIGPSVTSPLVLFEVSCHHSSRVVVPQHGAGPPTQSGPRGGGLECGGGGGVSDL